MGMLLSWPRGTSGVRLWSEGMWGQVGCVPVWQAANTLPSSQASIQKLMVQGSIR